MDAQEILPVILNYARDQHRARIIVVGAGGIGARVIPCLPKILRQGDEVLVFDGDRVEERNIFRQHFSQEDIGLYKAEVMQSRYHTARVAVTARCVMMETSTALSMPAGGLNIVLGCLDNRAARRILLERMRRSDNVIYIDAGNDRRSGQVLMGWHNVMMRWAGTLYQTQLDPHPMMPQIFDGEDVDEDGESCGMRVDMQTMNVNNMAAATMVNAVATLLMGLPFSTCGWMFSTFNSMSAVPILRTEVNAFNGMVSLVPSRTYAAQPEPPTPVPVI